MNKGFGLGPFKLITNMIGGKSLDLASLESGAVRIWYIDASARIDSRYYEMLNACEKIRAEKYKFIKDKNMFITARSVLRMLSAFYLNKTPSQIEIKYGPFGKPYLYGENRLKFNISHSGCRVVLAFCKQGAIGVDIEKIKTNFDVMEIAENYFSEMEVNALGAIPQADQKKAFFRCWTRKESFLKAIGEGLSLPLDSFSVTLDDDKNAKLLETKWDPSEKEKWKMFAFVPDTNYMGAISVHSNIENIKYYRWDKFKELLLCEERHPNDRQ
ncbi:4'-phosphopantetheinyl transferase family protein [Arenibacter lacus]|uniref:4'-phosphopantetheinyl transferase family protein n=1 Tax=Arenibacter lacus TaxID=2608629 RepID=UPI00123DE294|nr:4'-phosphopantetheinyl transferase superfamily protein [Arenibacter lacus]